MAAKQEVTSFLRDFHLKMSIWSILYRDDRGKNTQTLAELEITPSGRNRIIEKLSTEDYSEGPLAEILNNSQEMWVFGKMVKGIEIYIKITMGFPGSSAICISFHPAEHNINYPFKA